MNKDNLLLVDAHVHMYDCFDLDLFFDSSFLNFKNVAASFGYVTRYTPILFMTEGRDERCFDRLLRLADDRKVLETVNFTHYEFMRTHEPFSLSVHEDSSPPLFLIAGHQIVTKEKLEVLALMTVSKIPDGLSLNTTFDSIIEYGGIPVLPWGFGKWMGKRGEILKGFLNKRVDDRIFLGDNSGRPAFLPAPPQFNSRKRNRIRILPGSDPLPFASECHKPGSFGCAISGSVDPNEPGNDLRRIIRDPLTRPVSFGQLETTSRFFKNQLFMQLIKISNQYKRKKS